MNNITEALLDTLLETIIDTAKLLPILFITYLIMEALEHYASERTFTLIKKGRGAGPLLGGLLGIVPQCGFAGGAASLYAGGAVTLGTLIAVFIATSDEMLPILISEGSGAMIWRFVGFKLVAAVISGFTVDIILRAARRGRGQSPDGEVNIGAVCERDGCDCGEDEHGGIFMPALRHTLKITAVIFAVSLAIGIVFCFVGEEELARLPINVPVLGEALAALFGLIPNCSVSVLLTKLYLGGVIGAGPMLAGLCANGGVGLLVLFRMNGSLKKNISVTALMWALGIFWGVVARIIFAFI